MIVPSLGSLVKIDLDYMIYYHTAEDLMHEKNYMDLLGIVVDEGEWVTSVEIHRDDMFEKSFGAPNARLLEVYFAGADPPRRRILSGHLEIVQEAA